MHPGGKKVLLGVGGQECSEQFNQFHNAAAVLTKYGPKLYVGDVEGSAKKPKAAAATAAPAKSTAVVARVPQGMSEPFGEQIPYGDPAWYQGANSPYYNDSHRKFRAAIREFVDKEIMPNCHEVSKQTTRAATHQSEYNHVAAYSCSPSFRIGCVAVNFLFFCSVGRAKR